MLINNPVITGSFIVNGVSVAGITGSSELSSSYLALSASYLITSASYAQSSASLSIRTGNLEATSSTLVSASSSFAAQSASLSTRVSIVEGQDATTGSNVFTGTQYISQASNAIGFTSTASLYTDGGLRVSKDSFVSGTAYFNNIVVYGTSSIEYITSSQVDIGANIITVNTDTPAVRFGGLSVFDSGSTQLTGSMLWDSQTNHWVYSNPSGSSYSGGMIMSGPRASSLGTEQGTTNNALMKGQGGDHITSSQMIDDGTTVRIPGNLQVTGSTILASTLTGTSATFSTEVTSAGSQGRFGGWATGDGYQGNALEVGVSGGTATLLGYNRTTGVYIPLLLGGNTNQTTTIGGNTVVLQNNGVTAVTIASTGAATFASSVTAANFISDGSQFFSYTLKGRASDNFGAFGFYSNNGATRYGYIQSGSPNGGQVVLNGDGGGSVTLDNRGMNVTGAATFSSSVSGTSIRSSAIGSFGFNTANNGEFQIYATAADGMIMAGRGSTNDMVITNKNGSDVFRIPTGTTTANFVGNVGIGTSSPGRLLTLYKSSTPILQFVDNISGTGASNGFLIYNAGLDAYLQNTSNGFMAFYTNDTERMRITSGGFLYVSNNGSYTNTSSTAHAIISNTNNNNIAYLFNTSASPYGPYIAFPNSSPNNSTNYFLAFNDGTESKCIIYSNGNIVNRNGSYGTISDIKYKENIIDASPKLNDLLKLKVRNFNMIGFEEKQIGFIAQEFEEVFPKMVDTSIDKDSKEEYKSIKTSVLTPMLVKAIQELSAKVDAQAAEINELKNR